MRVVELPELSAHHHQQQPKADDGARPAANSDETLRTRGTRGGGKELRDANWLLLRNGAQSYL